MAGRLEGATTRILRTTMDLSLDAVNAQLISAGEKAIDAQTLVKRRGWIRSKDGGEGRVRKVGNQKFEPTVKAKRKSPAPQTQPRKGTFAAFVYSQPYDIEVPEVMARAKAAGIMQGHETQVYLIRSKYPKPSPKVNPIATPKALRAEHALAKTKGPVESKALAAPQSLPANESLTLKQQFSVLAFRAGIENIVAWTREEYQQAQERLALPQTS